MDKLGPFELNEIYLGDCRELAARVYPKSVSLLIADPPYGMGKEKEGIANDNLYGNKLDAFQMEWWRACRPALKDNASVYIFGNAEDLWRLWYVGGLRDSERLTFRNEIVWDKENGEGMLSDSLRSYANCSERCLFFMLGEQGFNNNADNYWEGWEPIRAYLKEQRDLMKWDNAICKRLAGHSENSGCHWFDNSQWMMPTRETYESWRCAANSRAFKREYDDLKREYDDLKREYDDLKREYDDLKREFYSTRAFFDNSHDNMTDVWKFPRVKGTNRFGHPTPKPLEMIRRIIMTSSRQEQVILDPFSGIGTVAMAAESLNRYHISFEIEPRYVEIARKRLDAVKRQGRLFVP